MSKLILYHGSQKIIEKPLFGKGKAYNDYGLGFYLTEHLELAKEWACVEGIDGYCNKYELDISDLKILNLFDEKYTILNWLAILLVNRKGRISTPIEKRGREYIIENFLPKYEKYDVIRGYRADDSYFRFVRLFTESLITLKQLKSAMHLGKLGEQVVLKSKKAFSNIKFIDYIIADNKIYYLRRKIRDEKAREKFQSELENEEDGIFLRDIMKEGMKNDDECLR